jgi:hypothetical protein
LEKKRKSAKNEPRHAAVVRLCSPEIGRFWGPRWGPSADPQKSGPHYASLRRQDPQRQGWRETQEARGFWRPVPAGAAFGRKALGFKYRINGKEKKLSLGRYPDVSLQEARKRRDEARTIVAAGVDPAEERKRAELELLAQSANSFERVAEEYLVKCAAEGREAVTIKKSRWLLSLLAPAIGNVPVASIKPADLLGAIKPIHDKGTMKRRGACGHSLAEYSVTQWRRRAQKLILQACSAARL